jgi:hypothetical protein
MNEVGSLAQHSSGFKNYQTAMGEAWMQQSRILNDLANVLCNSSSTIPVEEDQHKYQQIEWRNSMEKWKKFEKKLREFDEFSVLDLKEWMWLGVSVMIRDFIWCANQFANQD